MSVQRTCLYKAYDAQGQALYIGVSVDWARRWKEHCAFSPWFYDVARLEIQWFPIKWLALDAERQAIYMENPRHNTAGAHKLSQPTICSRCSTALGRADGNGGMEGSIPSAEPHPEDHGAAHAGVEADDRL